jgi:hypothetical protein
MLLDVMIGTITSIKYHPADICGNIIKLCFQHDVNSCFHKAAQAMLTARLKRQQAHAKNFESLI